MARPHSAPKAEATCKRCGQTQPMRLRTRVYYTGATSTKPEPYCDKCRNDYRKAALRRRLGLPEDAVIVRRPPAAERPKIERQRRDPATPRTCTICKVFKAGSEFETYNEKKSGKVASRAMCRPCSFEYRRKNLAKNRALEAAGLKAVKPDFLCRVCKKNRISSRGGRCVGCYRTQLNRELRDATSVPTRNPSRSDGALRPSPPISRTPPSRPARSLDEEEAYFAKKRAQSEKQKQAAIERGARTGYGVIFISDSEWWAPGFKCIGCGKGILIHGLCYHCATGCERSVLRPAERAMA